MSKISKLNTARKIKDDPIGFLIDKVITFIVNSLLPIPIPSVLISQLKAPIIGFLGTLILLTLLLLIFAGTAIFSPLIFTGSLIEQIKSSFTAANSLNIPVDTSFAETKVPRQNPLGGGGMTYTTVTAYFLDPNYLIQFGRNHNGIDLVPSSDYYKNSPIYKEYKQVVVYSTINGTARHYVDNYGGETVEVTSSDNAMKVVFIHFSQVLVESGEVIAGTPLGIMGETGNATGEHVHYEVKIKDGDTWLAVNPLNYIK
jgi:murein DD-endopeptidase MepM/ murein hydrolase activator NlpD